MSIWKNINQRSEGTLQRKEDIKPVYFKLNGIDTFQPGERIVFNMNTSNECVGEYITYGRISRHPIFKLVMGKRTDVNNDIIYEHNGVKHYTSTTFIDIL